MSSDPSAGERFQPRRGFVSPDVEAEFPGLRVLWIRAPGRQRSSPPSLRGRLRELSDRYRGAGVVSMRTRPIPQAYRAFFRQIGLDPDIQRIPSERAAVTRLLHGGFRSVDLINDACLVALIETGVPVWALDAARVTDAGLGVRTATADDAVGTAGSLMPPPGSLVVADSERPHCVLFEDPPPGHGVDARTRAVLLFAIAVDGVPDIHVDEALWIAAEPLGPEE